MNARLGSSAFCFRRRLTEMKRNRRPAATRGVRSRESITDPRRYTDVSRRQRSGVHAAVPHAHPGGWGRGGKECCAMSSLLPALHTQMLFQNNCVPAMLWQTREVEGVEICLYS